MRTRRRSRSGRGLTRICCVYDRAHPCILMHSTLLLCFLDILLTDARNTDEAVRAIFMRSQASDGRRPSLDDHNDFEITLVQTNNLVTIAASIQCDKNGARCRESSIKTRYATAARARAARRSGGEGAGRRRRRARRGRPTTSSAPPASSRCRRRGASRRGRARACRGSAGSGSRARTRSPAARSASR